MRPLIDSIKKRCLKMRRKGRSYAEIATTLQLSKATVHKYTEHIALSKQSKKRLQAKVQAAQLTFVQNYAQSKTLSKKPRWGITLARLIAHCIFDGSVTPHKVNYTNTSKVLIDQFIEDMESCYAISPTSIDITPGTFAPKYTVTYCSTKLCRNLLNWVPSRSMNSTKAVSPVNLFSSSPRVISEFLRAFWEDEGCITIGGELLGRIKNKELSTQLVALHQLLGIDATLYTCSDGAYTVRIKRNKQNIRAFRSVAFKDALIVRGLNKGMLKRDLFNKLFSNYLSDGLIV